MNKIFVKILILVCLFIGLTQFSYAADNIPSFTPGKITPMRGSLLVNPDELGASTEPENATSTAETRKMTVFVTNILAPGSVEIRGPDGAWKPLASGDIEEGAEIRTHRSGAFITLPDGSLVEVGPDSSFTLNHIELREDLNALSRTIDLWEGKIKVKFRKTEIGKRLQGLEIRTGGGAGAVRGTEFVAEYIPDIKTTKFYLYEGLLDASNLKNEIVQLQPMDMITIDGDGKMTLEKMSEGQWEQLSGEFSSDEALSQEGQPGAATRDTAVKSRTKTLIWVGLAVILLCSIGAGIFIYRKKS